MTVPLNRQQEFTNANDIARFNMIEQQIRPWHAEDACVLKLLSQIKREAFVPESSLTLAFMDINIPLVDSTRYKQYPECCMLPPKVEARILVNLQVQAHERVLQIGAGSGYLAALLAAQAKSVLALEIESDLVQFAQHNLASQNITNVEVLHADGSQSIPEGGFDVIVLTGSVVEIAPALLSALNQGGRLLACVGQEPVMRMNLVRKHMDQYDVSTPWDFNLPKLRGFEQPNKFEF